MIMWFFKKDYNKILALHTECDIKFEDDFNIEFGGMFKENKLHGYAFMANHKNGKVSFGIFKNGSLYKNLGSHIKDIQNRIGKNSIMISSKVFGKGVYLGEAMSPAGHQENPKLRTNRYGIMILDNGMYIGEFPAGFFLTRCIGYFFDLEGNSNEGTFEISIEDNKRWGDDQLGQYFPSY